MRLEQYQRPDEFLSVAGPFLEENEAENSILLGVIGGLARATAPSLARGGGDAPLLCAVQDAGHVVAAAIRTPPYKLLLSRGPAIAIAMIADWLARGRQLLPGVVGPFESAQVFVTAWSRLSRQRAAAPRYIRAHRLDRVRDVPPVPGTMSPAAMADAELLSRWVAAFHAEIHEPAVTDPPVMVADAIARQRLFVWRDAELVSMAAWTAPTNHGVRIHSVYTPPAMRRRGYATALVAALSRSLLKSGRRSCFLYSDLVNPTSNDIYARIGYEPVSDLAHYTFTAEGL